MTLEDMSADLLPVEEIEVAQVTADVAESRSEIAIETAVEAVEIAQDTLSEVQTLREDINQTWQNEVISKLDQTVSLANQLLARMESLNSQPIQPEAETETESLDLTIQTTAESDNPVSEGEKPQGKKKKARRRKVRL